MLQKNRVLTTRLPWDVITDINTIVNQNQLLIEMLALKHCRLQSRLNSKLGSVQKQLYFYRRRDLRYLFLSAADILSFHFEDQDFETTISVQEYVKALLEGFVDCMMHLPHMQVDERCLETSGSIRSSQSVSKERLSINDSNGSIEVHLQVVVPTVAFSDKVQYHEY
jgi:hypothetical protein